MSKTSNANTLAPTTVRAIAIVMTVAGLAGCSSPAPAPGSRDVGNMAYPTPLPQGNVGTSSSVRQAPDVGNMAYPQPLPQGNVGTSSVVRQAPDVGNMAYPQPLPQGNVGSTRTR